MGHLCFFRAMLTLHLKDFYTPRWSYLVDYALLRQGGFDKDSRHWMVHGLLANGAECGNSKQLLVLRPPGPRGERIKATAPALTPK